MTDNEPMAPERRAAILDFIRSCRPGQRERSAGTPHRVNMAASRAWLGQEPLCRCASDGPVDWSELGDRRGEPIAGNAGPATYQRHALAVPEIGAHAPAPSRRRSNPLVAVIAAVLLVYAAVLWMEQMRPRPAVPAAWEPAS
jgi:hypothetical protein